MVLSVKTGAADDTSPYQAELTGFELAIANTNTRAKLSRLTELLWFFTGNQTSIRDIIERLMEK